MNNTTDISFEQGMALFSKLPNIEYIKNNDGIYVNSNLYAINTLLERKIIEIPSQKLLFGKDDNELYSGEIAEIFTDGDSCTLKNNDLTLLQEEFTLNDITYKQLSFKRPFLDHQGNIIGIFGNTIDISHLSHASHNFLHNIKLSKREKECLYWTLRGKTSKEIARVLEISFRTVEIYTSQVVQKLKCKNKKDLIDRAIEHGIIHFSTSLELFEGIDFQV